MSSVPPDPLPLWPVDTLDIAGAQLAVRRAEPTRRDVEPALYVHGLGGSATNWTDLMGRLRDRVDGEALDLPGFGFSPPPKDGDFSPDGYARTVVSLLEYRDRGPVHLFGNSLGGAVATLVAARRPDLVRTLTLVSPAMPDLRPRRHTLPMALMWLPGFGEAAQRYLTGLPPEKRMEGILELCFADPTTVPERRRIEAIEEIRRRNGLPYAGDAALASLRGLVSAYVAPTTRSPWSAARQVTVPTLGAVRPRGPVGRVAAVPASGAYLSRCAGRRPARLRARRPDGAARPDRHRVAEPDRVDGNGRASRHRGRRDAIVSPR